MGHHVFLVTCAHGIDDMPSDSVWVRRNISEVGRQCDEVRKDMWVRHPTEDVAAVSIAKPDSMESHMVNFQVFLHPEGTITRHNCRQNHIREGTDILMMGYPTGANYVGRYDYAVTRYGVVAQIEGWANGDHKDFLVDGNGFEGQSGGPVIMKPGMHLASDGNAYSLVQPKLLGMMVEYTRDTVDYHVPRQSERDYRNDIQVPRNTGLIVTIPIETILETVNLIRNKTSK